MNLATNKILVPQHIEYFIVDRNLVICEYSLNISRFFFSSQKFGQGQDIREVLPQLSNYQQIIKNILAGNIEYFSLPHLNPNYRRSCQFQRAKEIEQTVSCCPLPILSGSHHLANNSEEHYFKIITFDRQSNNPSSPSSCAEFYFSIHLNLYQKNNNNYLIIFLEEVINNHIEKKILCNKLNQYNLSHNSSQLSYLEKQSDYFYEQVFTSMAEALIITNDMGIIQQVNQSTVDLLGYSQAELIDKSINTIIADPNFLLSEIQQYLLTQGELIKNIEVVCQTKQELTQIISFTCAQIKTTNNDDHKLIYLGRDITNLKHYQQRQNIQSSVSKVLAASQDFTQAAPKILQIICERLDLMVGEIWIALDKVTFRQQLKCEAIWAKNSSQVDNLIKVTQESVYQIEEDIIGDIWLSNSFFQYNHCSSKSNFFRQNIALEAGLEGGFGLPIHGDDSILAVMNFSWNQKRELDENIADLMLTIANQIGQFIQRKQAETALREQQEESEQLLLNILPKMIAEQLKKQNRTIADHFESVTILFADLVNFTQLFSQLPPIEIVEILNEVFSEFDRITTKYGLEKIKIIGDAYMVVGGLPQPREDHAEAIAEMALEMQQAIEQFNLETDKTLSIRIGINTGAVVAGVIGTKKFIYDLWGEAVNIAHRMESHGVPNRIQVTASTYQLLKQKYILQPRGDIQVKSKGKMSTYFLVGRK